MDIFADRHINIHNWPGQSSLVLGILEDVVTSVFSLESTEQRTNSFVATYILNKNTLRGQLLRRPFDALSDLEVELSENFASRLLQKNSLTLEYSSLGQKQKFKTFSKSCSNSFLPLLLNSEDIYLEIALLNIKTFDWPKTLGSAVGQRWKTRHVPGSCQTLVASGTCESRPFMFVYIVKNDTAKLELRMGQKTAEDTPDESDNDSEKIELHPDPEQYQNPFAPEIASDSSESESVSESVALSIQEKLDRVQEGQASLSELRSTLQYPRVVKRQCSEKEKECLIKNVDSKESQKLDEQKAMSNIENGPHPNEST